MKQGWCEKSTLEFIPASFKLINLYIYPFIQLFENICWKSKGFEAVWINVYKADPLKRLLV